MPELIPEPTGPVGAQTVQASGPGAEASNADLPASDTPDAEPTMAAVAETMAQAVLAVPGVIRLEPSMKTSLNRLRSAGLAKTGRPATVAGVDGIVLATRNGLVTATVDIATNTNQAAVVVADTVQHVVHALLIKHGRPAGPISVSVLSVEPA